MKAESELNLAVTVRKVQQVLFESDHLQYRKLAAALALKERYRRQRIKWTTDH